MKIINLSTKTFGIAAKKEVINLFPSAKFIKKSHVAGCGYVHFIKDEALNILGKVYSENGQAKLSIN